MLGYDWQLFTIQPEMIQNTYLKVLLTPFNLAPLRANVSMHTHTHLQSAYFIITAAWTQPCRLHIFIGSFHSSLSLCLPTSQLCVVPCSVQPLLISPFLFPFSSSSLLMSDLISPFLHPFLGRMHLKPWVLIHCSSPMSYQDHLPSSHFFFEVSHVIG